MSYLDTLQDLSEIEEGVLLEFLLQYKFDNNNVHLFYEGYEDPSFYNSFIPKFISNNSHSYIAKGKYKLYNVYDDIDWDIYDKNRVLVFTDRDYSELLGEDIKLDNNVYTTEFYSIENHVVSTNLVGRILRDFYHFTDEDRIQQITEKFSTEYFGFFRATLYVSGWILHMRRAGVKIHLDSVDLGNLFDISKEKLKLKSIGGQQYEYLEKVTNSITPENSEPTIKEIIQEIKSMNPKKIIRGKFEIWFLVRFLLRLKENEKLNGNTIRLNTQLNGGNCLEIVGSKCDIPPCLETFLKAAAQRLISVA